MSLYQLRQLISSDFNFVKRVHHITLKDHVSKIWGWNESTQDVFIREDFESNEIQIIQSSGKDVGYLQLNKNNVALNIINILLLPEFQNQKLGTTILQDLILRSREANIVLNLGVFKINVRAKKLYEQLGFKTYSETETHYLMQIEPGKWRFGS